MMHGDILRISCRRVAAHGPAPAPPHALTLQVLSVHAGPDAGCDADGAEGLVLVPTAQLQRDAEERARLAHALADLQESMRALILEVERLEAENDLLRACP